MAHGFSGTRRERRPAYAERSPTPAFAVLLFDYRGFGDSGGGPRQVIDIKRQQEDYEAAIATARNLDGVDPDRIALFGTSFSGGHVVSLASRHPELAAVIAQVPFADGIAQLKVTPTRVALRGTIDGIRDLIAGWRGLQPVMIKPTGPPGSYAVMTAPEADPGFRAILGEDSLWLGQVGARIMLFVGTFRPVAQAADVKCPLLVQVGERDETTPPEPAIKMAERAPRGELKRYPVGHFDPYVGDTFEQFVSDQVAFLQRALTPQQAPVAA